MSAAPEAIQRQIRELVGEFFDHEVEARFVPGETTIPLNIPSWGGAEVWEAIESLLTGQVTMGSKVRRFEDMFAHYIGVKHAIMVNSGSSANLLALSVLTNPAGNDPLRPGDEVITPAVTWATTVWPISMLGLIPVLVDIDLETFNLDANAVREAVGPKTRAIMPVHLLGNACPMDEIMSIANEHDLLVIEDACEAHGAEIHGQKVGSFGALSTFSFFFSHHISTIEGGMVLTNDDSYAEIARSMRAFGWIRELNDREALSKKYPETDPRFLFVNTGYNLRPTELQGAFGVHQLPRLEAYIEHRRSNACFWVEQLAPYKEVLGVHYEREETRHVYFGFPLIVRPGAPFSRQDIVQHLDANKVETRPVMAGNIDEQPAMDMLAHRTVGDLANARAIHRDALFFGNHHGIGSDEREAIAQYLTDFLDRY